MDPMGALILTPLLLIALVVLFNFAWLEAPKPNIPPGPILVDLGALTLRVEIEMNAIEILLRQRHQHREGEGARQLRAAVREFLEREMIARVEAQQK